jgi:hypothetical protein
MKKALAGVFVGVAALCALPAVADDLIAEYYSRISPRDMVNSSGEPLRDWCAMIQQDRANYHRFGMPDADDQGDPIFASREARAAIAGNCRVVPNSEYVPTSLERGETRYVWVRVYGSGGRPAVLMISEGAG